MNEEVLDYIRDNRTWTDEQETRALYEIDRMRCPLSMTHDGEQIEQGICDLLEEFGEENDLPEGWWLEEGDAEDIFWML